MPGLRPDVDPDGLLEYSVVFTDRSLNHMSAAFQTAINDIGSTLRTVYQAHQIVIVPGGGSYAMEAVARQFANNASCLVLRNGWFSYRWTQILQTGRIASDTTVMKARPAGPGSRQPFAPAPVDEVVARIRRDKPAVVFAPHVETSAGVLLPDSYVRAVADAVHDTGGLFVLDSVASGALWVDMEASGVDVLISAPQKGWSATPCAGLVMLSERAAERMRETTSTSFACDLKKWRQILKAYEDGGHAYHATMPTDGLVVLRDAMAQTAAFGFDQARRAQIELGAKVRELLAGAGFPSVAADGFMAPSVVVSYTDDPAIHNGSRFAAQGLQIAAGVPLQCDEPADFRTFRIGLFGLDKLADIHRTVGHLRTALGELGQDGPESVAGRP